MVLGVQTVLVHSRDLQGAQGAVASFLGPCVEGHEGGEGENHGVHCDEGAEGDHPRPLAADQVPEVQGVVAVLGFQVGAEGGACQQEGADKMERQAGVAGCTRLPCPPFHNWFARLRKGVGVEGVVLHCTPLGVGSHSPLLSGAGLTVVEVGVGEATRARNQCRSAQQHSQMAVVAVAVLASARVAVVEGVAAGVEEGAEMERLPQMRFRTHWGPCTLPGKEHSACRKHSAQSAEEVDRRLLEPLLLRQQLQLLLPKDRRRSCP